MSTKRAKSGAANCRACGGFQPRASRVSHALVGRLFSRGETSEAKSGQTYSYVKWRARVIKRVEENERGKETERERERESSRLALIVSPSRSKRTTREIPLKVRYSETEKRGVGEGCKSAQHLRVFAGGISKEKSARRAQDDSG